MTQITDSMAATAVHMMEVAVTRDGLGKVDAFRLALDESGIAALIDENESTAGRDAELLLHVSRASDLLTRSAP